MAKFGFLLRHLGLGGVVQAEAALPPSTQLKAWLADGLAHQQAGRFGAAERLCRQVLAANPRHADALHLLGVLALEAGQPAVAADLIGQAIQQNGQVAQFHYNLGRILQGQGRIDKAGEAYRQAIRLDPECAEARHNLAIACQARTESVTLLAGAVALKPDFAEAYVNLGALLGLAGHLTEAAACCRRALFLRPGFAEAEMIFGNVLRQLGLPQQAAIHYRNGLAAMPNSAETIANLAHIVWESGKAEKATALLRRALVLDPSGPEAWVNLGTALVDLARIPEAESCCRRALWIRPEDPILVNNLAANFRKMGAQAEALRCVALCLERIPADPQALLQRLMFTLPIIPDSAEAASRAIEAFDRGLEEWRETVLRPDMRLAAASVVGNAQPFYLTYRHGNHLERLSRYGDVVAQLTASRADGPAAPYVASPRKRISLAVVSRHIRHHSVWDIILHGLLAHLDRDRFDISLINLGLYRDSETDRAEALVDRFHGDGLNFQRALSVIRDERPDILFFPEIGQDTATLRLAALRLAPLQATGWGQPITSGLPTIDLFFSGELLEAEDADKHYCERLVRLAGTGTYTLPPPTAVEQPTQRAIEGMTNFVLCQNPFKFDPADDDLYPQIARLTGPCCFWLMYDPRKSHLKELLVARLSAAFRRHGLDPAAYLREIPWLPPGQFLGFLETMDVYLDCPAFSGYTTAWQAIRSGIPIVTLEGQFLRQRLAAGLLRQIGRADTIAMTAEEYVATAVRLAAESRRPTERQARREGIKTAAPKADQNLAAIRGFEHALIEELGRRGHKGIRAP